MTNIQELVNSFMTDYTAKVEAESLPIANAWADKALHALSKDMNEETTNAFIAAARTPLNDFLKNHTKDVEEAVVNEEA